MLWRHTALLQVGSSLLQVTVWLVRLASTPKFEMTNFKNFVQNRYWVQVTLWDIGRPSPPSYKGIPRKLLRVAAEMTPDLYRLLNCAPVLS